MSSTPESGLQVEVKKEKKEKKIKKEYVEDETPEIAQPSSEDTEQKVRSCFLTF